MCSKQDPLSLFKGLQMGIFVFFSQKATGTKNVSMATTWKMSLCFFRDVHSSNTSRDILDSILYCSSRMTYDVITFLI